MKNVKLLNLSIRNFKGCKDLDISFNDGVTVISGPNASGKTTINDAHTYLCFGTDSEGNSKFAARPLNEDGKEIDNIETSVEGTFSVDGEATTFKKILRQVWTRHRGSSAPTYEGNETLYFVDGVPRKKKEYEEKVAEIFDENTRLISDLGYFVNLKDKDKKAILLKLIGDISDEEVINSDPKKWAPIADDVLSLGDVDAKTKARGEITKLNNRQKEIPGRIDEVRMHIADAEDTAGLEAQLKELTAMIASDEKVIAELKSQTDTSDLGRQKKNLISQMNDMIADANMDIRKNKQGIQYEITSVGLEITNKNVEQRNIASQIKAVEHDIEVNNSRLTGLKKSFDEVSVRTFDEKQTVCKACGQNLPPDQIADLKKRFDEAKKAEIQKIQSAGKSTKFELESKRNELVGLQTKAQSLADSVYALQKRQKGLEADLNGLPKEITDLSGNAEYEALKNSVAVLDDAIEKVAEKQQELEAVTDRFHSNRFDARRIEVEIANIQAQNNKNKELKSRIEELEDEQRENGQKIALAEQKIILLEEFSMQKARLLSEKVTNSFGFVNFALFTPLINGGIQEACEITVGGVRWKDLNTGARIAASLDIIRTFQNKLGISCPIFVDGSEAINIENIPKMPCQMILLRVTDGKGLTIS